MTLEEKAGAFVLLEYFAGLRTIAEVDAARAEVRAAGGDWTAVMIESQRSLKVIRGEVPA